MKETVMNLYFWLGADAEHVACELDPYQIEGNQFVDGPILFIPEIDLTDGQSDE